MRCVELPYVFMSGLVTRMHGGVLILLGDFDDPALGIDLDPVTGLDDLQRIPIEISHGGSVSDDRAERDLGRHLVEEHGSRRGSRQARDVELTRPSG